MGLVEIITKFIKGQVNNLMPVSLEKECEKASKIMEDFAFPELDKMKKSKNTHTNFIKDAKGLAILSVGKIGVSFTIKGGSGILITRQSDGTWSAPSALSIAGVGVGHQFGVEIIDLVIVLNTKEAVQYFSQKDSITLSASTSVSLGNMGRLAEGGSTISGIAAIYSYSRSRGAFIGMSIEGAMIMENEEANAKYYGEGSTTESIINGKLGEANKPVFAHRLYGILYAYEALAYSKENATTSTFTPPPQPQPTVQASMPPPPTYTAVPTSDPDKMD